MVKAPPFKYTNNCKEVLFMIKVMLSNEILKYINEIDRNR